MLGRCTRAALGVTGDNGGLHVRGKRLGGRGSPSSARCTSPAGNSFGIALISPWERRPGHAALLVLPRCCGVVACVSGIFLVLVLVSRVPCRHAGVDMATQGTASPDELEFRLEFAIGTLDFVYQRITTWLK